MILCKDVKFFIDIVTMKKTYRLDLATRSSSSFFLIAYEFEEPLAALMSSSARLSAMDLMFLNEASRAPVQSSQMAWFTRRSGETSTAWRRTVPARPIRVESSRGPELMIAVTNTWKTIQLINIFFLNNYHSKILDNFHFFIK